MNLPGRLSLQTPLFTQSPLPTHLTLMHILLVTHYYEPELGAPQRRWAALVQRLMAHGHSVTVLCPPPHYPDSPSTEHLRNLKTHVGATQTGRFGETIIRMPYLLHGYSGKARALDQLLTAAASTLFTLVRAATDTCSHPESGKRRMPYDVVVSTVPGLPSLFAGVAISKALKIPHVAEMRDAWPDVVTGDLASQTKRLPLHKKLAKHITYRLVTAGQRKADALVTTTEWFSSILHTRGIQKVFVVPNGAEENDFSSIDPLTPTDTLNRPVRVQYLGTVGRSQGLEVLVDALALIRQQRSDLEFLTRIVGEGAEIPLLKQKTEDAGVHIEFAGTVAREHLVEAYRWADIELVSLRKTKPFSWTIPSKIFELLATRRHIVAAVEGSAASVIQQSGVGTVVEPGNADALAKALIRLADDPTLLHTDDSGIALLRSTYSYDHMAKRFEDLLEQTVSGGFSGSKNIVAQDYRRRFSRAGVLENESTEAL